MAQTYPTYSVFDRTALADLLKHFDHITDTGGGTSMSSHTVNIVDGDGEEQTVIVRWYEGTPRICVFADADNAPGDW